MQKYNKAIMAVLGGVVTLVAMWVPGIEDVATPEFLAALGTLLTTALVYAVPNKAD